MKAVSQSQTQTQRSKNMTDRVEIKPDDTSETLEQSAEKLQKEGVDVSKDAVTNKDGETATLTEVKKEVPQETRPDWLPEKRSQDTQERTNANRKFIV